MNPESIHKAAGVLALITACLLQPATVYPQEQILVEAESFQNKGGWLIDQQSFEVLGSSYLLAHGMGEPVPDATTEIHIDRPGSWQVWVRTRDWAPYPKGPGEFRIAVDGMVMDRIFGSEGSDEWLWYHGGEVKLEAGTIRLELKDLTGFEGRCDAILLSRERDFVPPSGIESLDALRRELLGYPDEPESYGPFDVVVVGGGIAGITTAVQSSRLGLRVALIQNRPVLGGNNSSEIRIHLEGDLDKNHYPKLGRIVRELDNGDPLNAHPDGSKYGDERKLEVVRAEKNISLFLNTHVSGVEMSGTKITAAVGRNIETNQEYRFPGTLFADCTGDGTLGYLAGADFRMGRESRNETGESMAPQNPDELTMGSSNFWNAVEDSLPSDFPEVPWALPFSDEYYKDATQSDWTWETGFIKYNTIWDAEKIRDHNLRVIYGNWSYLKNQKKDKYANWRLNWVGYISGKRESRRLLGDHILSQQDLHDDIIYPDGFVTLTREDINWSEHPDVRPYPIPYRCLYSRNIQNLMMAGRNISVTHAVLGKVRAMRTTGMMGEVLGHAAYLCIHHNTDPRGVYQSYLEELKELLSTDSP
jgi:hypothetical protein